MKASELLINALDYIKQFKDQIFVIKLGGEVIPNKDVIDSVAKDLSFLRMVDIHPVIVHGGGKEITNAMNRYGKKPKFIEGLRVTDKETIGIVGDVLSDINGRIVSKLNEHGNNAIGLSGKSKRIFHASVSNPKLGLVGKIEGVNAKAVHDAVEKGYIPVIIPLGFGNGGETLNINADTAASELAIELNASKLIVMTNVAGVMNRKNKLISSLTIKEAKQLIKTKTISGGMIPKLSACINAIGCSVKKAHIVKATKHAILEEILTVKGTGTMITK